ncbi:hypothetical protein [Paenarthrobacter sp. NPDC090522]|uniref:hypothetical protein n=1 Tax=Paenarthrobacter sp. NPDC090522 TaxID=3364383 RepID=UPI003820F5C0
MMAVLAANPKAGTFHVVCKECLWAAPRPLHEDAAFTAADAHKPDCPGEIPAARTAAQTRHARKLLTGSY